MDVAIANQSMMIDEQEYLAREQASEIKHELIDGHVFAMAGASMNHQRICANISREFGVHLRGQPCEVVSADMKVKVANHFFYPDVMVDCEFDESQPYYSTSPVIIVEVLSKSTRRTDQTIKRLHYMNLPSLQEYVLIDQDIVDIEVIRKSDDWRPTRYFLSDEIYFESIDLTLSVADIYERVNNQDMNVYLQAKQLEQQAR